VQSFGFFRNIFEVRIAFREGFVATCDKTLRAEDRRAVSAPDQASGLDPDSKKRPQRAGAGGVLLSRVMDMDMASTSSIGSAAL